MPKQEQVKRQGDGPSVHTEGFGGDLEAPHTEGAAAQAGSAANEAGALVEKLRKAAQKQKTVSKGCWC